MSFIIGTEKLSGHKESILCLDTNSKDCNQILSGSEDKSVRLWDLRTNRTQKCFVKCFKSSVECVLFHSNDENIIYAASGTKIFTFDVRIDKILVTDSMNTFTVNDDDNEINAMDFKYDSNGGWIAVGDDAGTISIFPIESDFPVSVTSAGMNSRRLTRFHSNIIGSISFKPSNTPEILSGGFDCKVCSWDYSKCRTLANNNFTITTTSKQVVNPPFVQSIKHIFDGDLVICALGNGSLQLLKCKDLSVIASVEAHASMATCLHVCGNTVYSGGNFTFIFLKFL